MARRMLTALLAGALLVSPLAARPGHAQSLGERILQGGAIAAQGLFITTPAEIALGRQTAAQVLAKTPEVNDVNLAAYVNTVGQKVASHAERRDVPYNFHVVVDPVPNAFSLAGGFVFVTTGCLHAMKNEAQLAGVLGHEVGHVVHKDQVREIRRQLIAQGVATGVLGYSASQLSVLAANIGATLVLRGYGRSAEYAADLTGAQYASAAGYEPRELSRFLGVLATISGSTPSWLLPLADHPQSADRIQRLDAFVAARHLPSGALNQAPYAAAVTPALARLGGGAGR